CRSTICCCPRRLRAAITASCGCTIARSWPTTGARPTTIFSWCAARFHFSSGRCRRWDCWISSRPTALTAMPRARAPCWRSRRYDALRRQGDLGSRRCRLVHHPLSPRPPRAPHAEAAAQRSRPRDRADGDLGHGTGGPSLYLRGQQRPALRRLSVPAVASVDRRRAIRRLAVAVLPHAQGSRAQLVGDAGSARPAHAGDERRLQPRAASDVFGVLAVGAGAGAPVAELDCGAGGPDRLRDVVLSARRTRGGADDRDLWPRLPPLHGAGLAHLAGELLGTSRPGLAEAGSDHG